jgi:hypothetical protein
MCSCISHYTLQTGCFRLRLSLHLTQTIGPPVNVTALACGASRYQSYSHRSSQRSTVTPASELRVCVAAQSFSVLEFNFAGGSMYAAAQIRHWFEWSDTSRYK